MKKLLIAAFLAGTFCAPADAGNPTPLTVQIDRSQNPSPVCLNRLTSAPGCKTVIGTIDSSDVWTPFGPASAPFAASAFIDATNANNISAGTLGGARLPNPQSGVLGGVLAASGATHQFQTGIDISGSPIFAQPSASDVSGLAPSATTDTTNATNITSGTLPCPQLPILTGAVSSSGCAVSFPSQTANTVLAAPNGASGAPGFRALVSPDLPNFLQSGTGAASRSIMSKLQDTVSVVDFGADPTGVADSSTAFTNALAIGKNVRVPFGTYLLASEVTIPAYKTLDLDQGATLKPSGVHSMISIAPGGWMHGGIIDVRSVSFTTAYSGIEFNGDYQATSGYGLNIKTGCDGVQLYGATGVNTGIAINAHADNLANARVMGVDCKASVYGFEVALQLKQNSTDTSQFVNGNRFDIWSTYSWRALYMYAPNTNYGLDGNIIRIQHQPLAGVTAPSALIQGEDNNIYIIPWDWNTVAGTSPDAVIVASGARYNNIQMQTTSSYLGDVSGQLSNTFITEDKRIYGAQTSLQGGPFYPPYPSGAAQTNTAIWGGGGVPSNSLGTNGDIYINSGGSTGTTIYQKRGGSWVGIL